MAVERQPFSFLVCPDAELLKQKLAEMLAANPPAGGQWEKLVFWGDEEPGPRYWESLGQSGLFGGARVLVARQAQLWPAAVWKTLSAALGKAHAGVWPIFCLEVGWEKGKFKVPAHIAKTRCMVFAEKKGWVWTKQGLNGQAMREFVQSEAKKLKLSFSGRAFDIFCDSTTPDAASVCNELAKLALASADGQISENMISRDSSSPESDAFACVKKIMAGDLSGAWREISRGDAASLLFFLIALLARECRVLWQLNAGEKPWLHPSEAAAKRALAAKIGQNGVGNAFCALADAEWNVKSGKLNPDQALENLCVKLTKIFSA